MTTIMTPSKQTTTGQIDKAVGNYRALLEKHSGEFSSEAVQTALGQPELANEQLAVFRRRVEMVSNLIIRKVKVIRSRTPQEALDAINHVQYTNRKVVDAMPKGESDEVEVVFFKLNLTERNDRISDDDLEKEYTLRGLKPADPVSVAAVNEADCSFSDEKPHCTHWKDVSGKWCYATFHRLYDQRKVSAHCYGNSWSSGWWFAGVRK